MRNAIEDAFKAEGRQAPPRLWHDFIFYTSGEVTRITLGEIGAPPYRHYGEVTGVYGRDKKSWDPMLPILERTWSPFLTSGSTHSRERSAALRAFAKALPALPE